MRMRLYGESLAVLLNSSLLFAFVLAKTHLTVRYKYYFNVFLILYAFFSHWQENVASIDLVTITSYICFFCFILSNKADTVYILLIEQRTMISFIFPIKYKKYIYWFRLSWICFSIMIILIVAIYIFMLLCLLKIIDSVEKLFVKLYSINQE